MLSESVAIFAVLVLCFLLSLRAKYRQVSAFILPFLSIPLFYLVAVGILWIKKSPPPDSFLVGMVIAGAIAGFAGSALLSFLFRSKRYQLWYLIFSAAFSAGLMVAYLINI